MEHINQLIAGAASQVVSPTMTQAGQTDYSAQNRQQAVALINQTFKELKGIFTAWAVAIKDPEIESQTRRQWLIGFIENGIDSDHKINIGLAACRKLNSPFLPSVGQFIFWCNDTIDAYSGIPTESEARLQMLRELGKSPDIRQWHNLHPIIYWAYSQRTSFEWKEMKTVKLDEEFKQVWASAMKLVRKGHVFQDYIPPSQQIAHDDSGAKPTAEEAERARLEVLSLLNEQPEAKALSAEEAADLKKLNRIRGSV